MTAHWPQQAISICLLLATLCLSPLAPTAAQSETAAEENLISSPDQNWVRVGPGIVEDIAWRPHTNMISVASPMGVGLHDTNLQLVNFIPDYHNIDEIIWNTTGTKLLVNWTGLTENGTYTSRAAIWDTAISDFTTMFSGTTERQVITSVDWCPDDNYVVGFQDGKPTIWNADTGAMSATLTIESSAEEIVCLANREIKVITEDCHLLTYRDGDKLPSIDILFSQSDCGLPLFAWDFAKQHFLFADADRVIHVVDSTTGQIITQLVGHTDYIYDFAWVLNDTAIISTSSDGTMRLWDALTGHLLHNLAQSELPITFVTVEPGGQRIATVERGSIVQVWDLEAIKVTAEYHAYGYVSARWSADGQHLVTPRAGLRNQIWNANTGTLIRTVVGPFIHNEPLAYLPYSSNQPIWNASGTQLADLLDGGSVGIFNRSTVRPKFRLQIPGIMFRFAAWSPDGSILATWGWDENNPENAQRGLWFWDSITGLPIPVDERVQLYMTSFTWSPDGTRIAFVSRHPDYDRQVHIIDNAMKPVLDIDMTEADPYGVTLDDPLFWSPDSRELMGGYTAAFGGVLFWDATTGEQVYQHTTGGGSVLSPDGRLFATSSGNFTRTHIIIWDRQTDRLFAEYKHPFNTDWILRWSPDGTRLASQSSGGPTFIFQVRLTTAETN